MLIEHKTQNQNLVLSSPPKKSHLIDPKTKTKPDFGFVHEQKLAVPCKTELQFCNRKTVSKTEIRPSFASSIGSLLPSLMANNVCFSSNTTYPPTTSICILFVFFYSSMQWLTYYHLRLRTIFWLRGLIPCHCLLPLPPRHLPPLPPRYRLPTLLTTTMVPIC